MHTRRRRPEGPRLTVPHHSHGGLRSCGSSSIPLIQRRRDMRASMRESETLSCRASRSVMSSSPSTISAPPGNKAKRTSAYVVHAKDRERRRKTGEATHRNISRHLDKTAEAGAGGRSKGARRGLHLLHSSHRAPPRQRASALRTSRLLPSWRGQRLLERLLCLKICASARTFWLFFAH